MDEKRSGSPSHEAFVGPVAWIIQQTPEMVSLERRRGPQTATFAYALLSTPPSATDRVVKAPTGDAPGHRGFWDGDRLVLETLQTIQGKTVTSREVLTLTAAGELVVERVVEVEHGYTMKDAQNFSAAKDVYVRAPR